MKKLFSLIVCLVAFVALAQAQTVVASGSDTLKGNETVNFTPVVSSTSSGVLTMQALCTEIGGTSDGTLLLQGSVDGISYQTVNTLTGIFDFQPNDTLTITDGAVMQAIIRDSPFKYFRWQGAGTASDTTLITPKHHRKR